jgi:hypothetical protein
MSDDTVGKIFRFILGGLKTGTLILASSAIVIGATAAVYPDPSIIFRGAADLAESLPLDVVRLALTVTVAAIFGNLVLVAALIHLVSRAASKPCLLFREDGLAVLARAAEKARKEA